MCRGLHQQAEACSCEYPGGCNAGQLKSEKCRNAKIYNISTIKSHCRYQSPVECNQVKFALNRVDIDLKRGSIDSYKDKISHKFNISGMSDDTIRGRLAFLSIYFEQLETTEITQSPSMTTTNLFGNVGGLLSKAISSPIFLTYHLTYSLTLFQIGLFLGFSLLASIEVLDLLIRISMIVSRTARCHPRTSP